MTRGQRNHNPLNIRKGSNWKGLSSVQIDKDFCQFDSDVYGIRAALIVLRTYYYKYNLYSIKQIINRFAPSSDGNNPSNYCYLIRKQFQLHLTFNHPYRDCNDDTYINLWFNKKQPKSMVYWLLRAMCIVESNYVLTIDVYNEALKLL